MEQNMNYLSEKNFYLSGPIEFGEEGNWRIPVIDYLVNKFNIKVFDPFSDPKQQWVEKINYYKKEKNFDKLTDMAKQFVRKDLGMVDRCDALIAYVPYKIPTVGTHHEIINANNMKKPVMLVCPQGKENVPVWYFGCLNHNLFFSNWNELYDYLEEANKGAFINFNRWNFIYDII
jgi:nucleoside 2-deoxyribosyltransferase